MATLSWSWSQYTGGMIQNSFETFAKAGAFTQSGYQFYLGRDFLLKWNISKHKKHSSYNASISPDTTAPLYVLDL
jgi:hypothetical protein